MFIRLDKTRLLEEKKNPVKMAKRTIPGGRGGRDLRLTYSVRWSEQ